MCLVLVAVNPDAKYPLVLAANRDERHDRPADALHWWRDRPGILAGRDRVAGGTWFGVGIGGRIATVLNDHRFPPPAGAPSRGEFVPAFLGSAEPREWIDTLIGNRRRYAGFHLLAGFGQGLYYCASASATALRLGPGLHTIDNAGLDIGDPRSSRARVAVGALLERGGEPAAILTALGDTAVPEAGTGDRRPVFIRDPAFGTRCSTVLAIDAKGRASCRERRFDATGAARGEVSVAWQYTRPPVAVCGG